MTAVASMAEGPACKKSKRDCKFQAEWKSSGMSVSKRGSSFAHCDVCSCDFSVAHGGVNDVKKHLATVKHQEYAKAASGHRSVSTFFQSTSRSFEDSVTRAEVLFANFIANITCLSCSLIITPTFALSCFRIAKWPRPSAPPRQKLRA